MVWRHQSCNREEHLRSLKGATSIGYELKRPHEIEHLLSFHLNTLCSHLSSGLSGPWISPLETICDEVENSICISVHSLNSFPAGCNTKKQIETKTLLSACALPTLDSPILHSMHPNFLFFDHMHPQCWGKAGWRRLVVHMESAKRSWSLGQATPVHLFWGPFQTCAFLHPPPACMLSSTAHLASSPLQQYQQSWCHLIVRQLDASRNCHPLSTQWKTQIPWILIWLPQWDWIGWSSQVCSAQKTPLSLSWM